MPAERRPDPIQPEPSQLVEAALLMGVSAATAYRPLADAAARRAVLLVGNEAALDLVDRCEAQMRGVAADLGVEFPR